MEDLRENRESVYRMIFSVMFWPIIWTKFTLDVYKYDSTMRNVFYTLGFLLAYAFSYYDSWVVWLTWSAVTFGIMVLVNHAAREGRETYREGLFDIWVHIDDKRIILQATDEFYHSYKEEN